jgi:hypothetical protein
MWAEKIFAEIESGELEQAKRHIETFQVLMKAKKIESEVLTRVLERMIQEIEG